jgi:hypothetical protein
MKGLLILTGESFRLGGQGNRNTGSDNSYLEQINAANSHIHFLEHLKENQNCDMDVFIASYNTKFNNELISIYSNYLIGYDYYEHLIGQNNLINNSLKNIQKIELYDFILFMRIDLFLKKEFSRVFDCKSELILFPSICFKPHHKVGIHPRVNDIMLYFPKKYFNYLKYVAMFVGHDQWYNFIENTDLKYDDLGTMLNTFHDSDSAKDWNPLYYIVNREESKIFHTKDEIFDKFNF